MRKHIAIAILGLATLIGCTDNEVELPEESEGLSTITTQISSVGFGDGTTGNRTTRNNNITWNHVFGGSGTIVFTNTSTVTPIDSTYTVDMADFAVNGLSKTLINGSYDVNLTMDDDTSPVAYVPVTANDNFDLTANTDLVLDANTTYGMILLEPYLVDASEPPTFDVAGTEYTLAEDQGYYYLYAPDGTTGTITLKESLFGQTVTKEVTIASTTIDALELVPVTSSAGVSLILEEFIIEFDQWNIDAPIGGITPSFGLFTDSGQALGNSDSRDVVLGDVDGDGDLDAFVSNYNQPNEVWMNDGIGNFANSGQILGASFSHGLSLGDLDGDGDLDAFIANGHQPNKVWINDGNGIFADGGQSLGNSDSQGVSLADLDGDGDLDAFVTNGTSQSNTVWFNNGTGVFTDSGQALGNSSSTSLSLADLDSDGDIDAFITNYGLPNIIWINDGTGTFIDSGQSLGISNSRDVSLGDIDGDGDIDAFTANWGQSNRLYLNDGNGNFIDIGFSSPIAQSTSISIGDLNGDGDLDVFIGNYNEPNKVWINDGNGLFTDSGQSLSNSNSFNISIGDLDGDGDLDVFVANYLLNKSWINN